MACVQRGSALHHAGRQRMEGDERSASGRADSDVEAHGLADVVRLPTLIVDNYDSFTYNLVHAIAEITQQQPIVIRNDELTWEQVQRLEFDRVIVSPGPGSPENPRDFGISKDA